MTCLTLYSIYINNDHVFKATLFKIEIICTFVKIINLKRKTNKQTNKAKQNKHKKQQQKTAKKKTKEKKNKKKNKNEKKK